jgi:hypothetical protein
MKNIKEKNKYLLKLITNYPKKTKIFTQLFKNKNLHTKHFILIKYFFLIISPK